MEKIRLTESQLQNVIRESVYNVLKEMNEGEELEEGWFGDKWNQAKSAYQTATQNNDMSLGQRFQNAKKNWSTQGNLNGLNNLKSQLEQYVDAGQIDPQTTIAQLIGGKYNNGRMGKMTGQINNRKSQISKRGGQSY